MDNKIEIFAKIRGIINFIEKEISTVAGSNDMKKEVLNICRNISDILGRIGELEYEKIISEIKEELNGLDDVVKKIENDDKNKNLFMLLICHIPDIRFLFLNKEEQERIIK